MRRWDRYAALNPSPFIFLLLAICSAKADLLFRDAHAEHTYRFESDQKSVEMKVTRQEVVELALYWAMNFYRDRSLEVVGLEFESKKKVWKPSTQQLPGVSGLLAFKAKR